MKRTVALGAAWTASAAAAVGLGFLAVSFVDASASPGTQPVAASTTGSAGATPDDSEVRGAPPSATRSPSSAPRLSTGEYGTAGGTVYANCTAGRPVVAGVPAAGWWVDDSNEPGKVEFESGTQEVEVRVSCADGSPVFVLDDASPSSSPASSSPATSTSGRDSDDSSGGDDSSGRGGGHGSDDDSSGHGSGGDDSDDD